MMIGRCAISLVVAGLAMAVALAGCGAGLSAGAHDTGYDAQGQGQLVLLVGEGAATTTAWSRLADELSASWRVARVDLDRDSQGRASSSPPSDAVEAWAARIDAVMASEGRESAVLIGDDWGGAIAWRYAILHPSRTDAVVVLGMPHPAAYARDIALNPEQRAAWSRRRDWFTTANPDKGAAEPGEDLRSLVINLPMLAIHGMDDAVIPVSALDYTWPYVSADSGVLRVPGAGHDVLADAPATVIATIVNWLDLHRK